MTYMYNASYSNSLLAFLQQTDEYKTYKYNKSQQLKESTEILHTPETIKDISFEGVHRDVEKPDHRPRTYLNQIEDFESYLEIKTEGTQISSGVCGFDKSPEIESLEDTNELLGRHEPQDLVDYENLFNTELINLKANFKLF